MLFSLPILLGLKLVFYWQYIVELCFFLTYSANLSSSIGVFSHLHLYDLHMYLLMYLHMLVLIFQAYICYFIFCFLFSVFGFLFSFSCFPVVYLNILEFQSDYSVFENITCTAF